MFRILKKSLRTGVVTGHYPRTQQSQTPTPAVREKTAPFERSLTIREVDTGSCNACEMEMNALTNPVYDVERFGIRLVEVKCHACGRFSGRQHLRPFVKHEAG